MKRSELDTYRALLKKKEMGPDGLWTKVIECIEEGFDGKTAADLDALGSAIARLVVYEIPPTVMAQDVELQQLHQRLLDGVIDHVNALKRQELMNRALGGMLLDAIVNQEMILLSGSQMAEAVQRLTSLGAQPFGEFVSSQVGIYGRGGRSKDKSRITPVGVLTQPVSKDSKLSYEQIAAALPVLVPQRLRDNPFVAEKGFVDHSPGMDPGLDNVDDFIAAALTASPRQARILLERVDFTQAKMRETLANTVTRFLCGDVNKPANNLRASFDAAMGVMLDGPLSEDERRRVWSRCLVADVTSFVHAKQEPTPFWFAALDIIGRENTHDAGKLVSELLQAGLDSNTRWGRFTPLLAAARAARVDAVEVLLSAGASPKAQPLDGIPALDACLDDLALAGSSQFQQIAHRLETIRMLAKAHAAQRAVESTKSGRRNKISRLEE